MPIAGTNVAAATTILTRQAGFGALFFYFISLFPSYIRLVPPEKTDTIGNDDIANSQLEETSSAGGIKHGTGRGQGITQYGAGR